MYLAPAAGGGTSTEPIPTCAGAAGARPCWRLVADPGCVPIPDVTGANASQYRIQVDRAAPPPPGSTARARCAAIPG